MPESEFSQLPPSWPCIVVNTDTMAISEYTNYEFVSFANFNGVPLALHRDGNIYRLGGDTDNGSEIDATFETGMDDMGSSKSKRLIGMTIGLRSDGETQYRKHGYNYYGEYISIDSTEEETIETRKLPSEKFGLSRVIGIEFSNVDGSDFSVDSMELDVRLSPRRSGGS